jgi:hypothetical protein
MPAPPEPIRRSLMVTLLAWGMMLMGALGLPISGITALALGALGDGGFAGSSGGSSRVDGGARTE